MLYSRFLLSIFKHSSVCIYVNVHLPVYSFPLSLFFLAGEGNEEISNMIHNYIKEIEDLRYSLYSAI